MRNTLGTYTPNYNLYMPSIGEQGWGNLVSNNFEILDTNLNDLQTQIDTINTNIGDGTRILSIGSPPIINSENFGNYAFYDENNVYIASFSGNTIFESISQPPHSCRLIIIAVSGDVTISGNINTYPTRLQSELPPDTTETNTYNNTITFTELQPITLTYTANGNNSLFSMDYKDYLNFIRNDGASTKSYSLSIPAATAAGGASRRYNGTAGSASNTCNGGGGGGTDGNNISYRGGTGCIFGQYLGGNHGDGYGYGSGAIDKYRCALVIIANGNLTINESCTITQIGGNGSSGRGGYGGGAHAGGGGGAPVFIYYTGTYVNSGTINTTGGSGYSSTYNNGANGGAGGIKTTKITL